MLKGLWDRCSELQALNFQCMSFMFPCLGFRSILDRRRFPTSLVQFQLLWVSLVCKTKASFDHGFWWFPAEILIVAMPKESIPADHWVVLAIIWPNVSISECWLPPNSPGSQWQVEEELKSQKIDDEERRRLEKALWKFMASLELLRSMGIWQSERQPISCWIGWWHLNTVCLSVLYAVLWCITMYYVYVCVYIYIHIHTEMWCPSRIDLVFPKSPDSLPPSPSPTPATAPGPDVPLQFGSGWGWWGATVENGWCVVLLKCFKRWEKKQWLVNTILISRANHQEILIAV